MERLAGAPAEGHRAVAGAVRQGGSPIMRRLPAAMAATALSLGCNGPAAPRPESQPAGGDGRASVSAHGSNRGTPMTTISPDLYVFAGSLQQFPLPSLQSAVAGIRKSWPVSFRLYGFQIGLANIPRSQIGCGTELVRTTAAASRKPS